MRSRAGPASSDLGSSKRGLARSGQPAFSYKHNENFMRKEGMCQASPFLERLGNFAGPKANFWIKACWKVAQFLARKPAKFASLIDSCIVSFSKLLKLWF